MTTTKEGLSERIAKAFNAQEQETVTVLSSLLAVQDEFGYIPEQAIGEVAEFTNSTINDVWGVASFYTNFGFTPPGTHIVELCWGTSCHVVGATKIIKAVFDGLGVEDEGETEDGKITVRYNTCLGACSQAPVIKIDERLIGRLSPEKAREMVIEARDGARKRGKNGR